MLDQPSTCPRCGSPLPADGSPCPRCLMALAVEPQAETTALPPEESTDLGIIGPYRLLSVLGEGGMGTVYLAEQRQPIQRRVALKLVRSGLAGKEVLARFEAERQALALMAHPGIARVLDAGTTDDGSPYFVMEYVHGEPITAWCDRKRLAMEERIALFSQACAAVQHAHQRGILHRDLKPSNLLVEEVDGEPKVRVIDFGLAKALHQRLTERTLFTERGQIVGTPEYMSPEQAAGEAFDVDTTTDVYSLGVVLYELLTGSLPHDPQRLREAGWFGMMKILREEEPKKPSTRVSTLTDETVSEIAKRRRTEPRTLTRSLSGDIDWILLKALDKERARRYANVSDLALDLDRHLSHQPVIAGPPSAGYRAGKFIQRHRLAIVAAGALLFLLAFSLALALRQLSSARRQRAEAQDRLEAERLVSTFGLALSGAFATPSESFGARARHEHVSAELGTLRQRLESHAPPVRAAGLVAASALLLNFGLEDLAATPLRQALQILEADPETPALVLAHDLQLLALVEGESNGRLEKALRIYTSQLGGEHPVTVEADCQLSLVRLRDALGGTFSGETISPATTAFVADAERCIERTAFLGPTAERLLARRLVWFGFYLQFTPDGTSAAREHLKRAVALLREQQHSPPWQLAEALELLGALGGPLASDESALRTLEEACSLREQLGGAESYEAALCQLHLGAKLVTGGRREAGVSHRRKALAVLESLMPEEAWRERYRPDEPSWLFHFDTVDDPFREDARVALRRALQNDKVNP